MPDIFISYSRRDGEFSKKLHQMFKGQQKDIWVDWEDIPLTSDWWTEIRRGIETSDNFLLIMSPDSIGSPVCQLEIEYARSLNKRIVPVFHRDPQFEQATQSVMERAKTDEHLRRMLEGREAERLMEDNKKVLSTLNWVFFKPEDDFEEKFRQLSQIIDADLTHIRQHTRWQVKALEWVESGKNISFALGGDELAAAETWLAASTGKQPQLSELHREFIAVSRKAENSRRRLLRGLQITSVVAGVLIVIAIGMALFSANQAVAANERADYAAIQMALAETAQSDSNERADYAIEQADIASTSQSNAEAEAKKAFAAQETAIFQAFVAATAQNGAEIQVTAAFEAQSEAILQANIAATAQHLADLNAADAQTQAAIAVESQNISVTQAQLALRNFGDAQTQVAIAATAQSASDKAAADSATQVAVIGTTLTPIAPTLTAVADKIETGENYAEAMRLSGEAVGQSQDDAADPRTAVLLAIQSLGHRYTELADSTLIDSLDRFYLVRNLGEDPPIDINVSAFLPDGRLLTAGDGIHLWDAQTGTLLKTLVNTDQFFSMAALSPDGTILVALNEGEDASENPVYAWRLTANSELRELPITLPPESGAIFNIVFAPDETPYLVLRTDECLLWSPTNGSKWWRYTLPCYDAVFSPDNQWIAILGDEVIRIYPTAGGDALPDIERGRLPESLSPAVFSPNSRLLAVANGNRIDLYDILANRQTLTLSGHTDEITTVNFTGDSRSLVTSSKDSTIRVWNVSDGQARRTLPSGGQSASVAISADGQWLVSTIPLTTQPAVLWTLAEERERQLKAGNSPVRSLAFSSDSRYLAGSGDDGYAVYDINTGEVTINQSIEIEPGPESHHLQTALQPGGSLLALMNDDDLTLLDIPNGTREALAAYTGDDYGWMTFTPDGSQLITVSASDGSVVIWDVATWQAVARWQPPAEGMPVSPKTAIYISPDGKTLLYSDVGATFAWDLTGGTVRSVLENLTAGTPLAYSPDGKWIAGIFSEDAAGTGQIRLVDAATGEVTASFDTQTVPAAMSFSPDGQWLAVARAERTIEVLDVATGEVVRIFNNDTGFTAVAFSPDGQWLAGGSKSGDIRLWDARYADAMAYACGQLAGYDFSEAERRRYEITDSAPTCP